MAEAAETKWSLVKKISRIFYKSYILSYSWPNGLTKLADFLKKQFFSSYFFQILTFDFLKDNLYIVYQWR